MKKSPEYLVCVPDGPIQHMEASWAKEWINIWDNGGIGYKGKRQPTKTEKESRMGGSPLAPRTPKA